MKLSFLNLSRRVISIKSRIVGVSLSKSRQELKSLQNSLNTAISGRNSIEFTQRNLKISPRLSDCLTRSYHSEMKKMQVLQSNIELKKSELQKNIHLKEQWCLLHSETLDRELATKETKQFEELIESRLIRSNTACNSLTIDTQKAADSEAEVRETKQSNDKHCCGEEMKPPIIAELVEGRILIKLLKEGDNLHLTLITNSLKDQRLLRRFSKKYARMSQNNVASNSSIKHCLVSIERSRR